MSKIITTHLLLDAAVDAVWQTLTDLAGYHRWNPFITAAAGTITVGERLELTIRPPGGRAMAFRPWVTAVEQHHYIEWLGRLALPGIFDGRHSFTLTPRAGGRTLLQQAESVLRCPDPVRRVDTRPHPCRVRRHERGTRPADHVDKQTLTAIARGRRPGLQHE